MVVINIWVWNIKMPYDSVYISLMTLVLTIIGRHWNFGAK